MDYENTISLGVRSAGNTVTAPFNVTADGTGLSVLEYVEINSTNGVPIRVTIYLAADYSGLVEDPPGARVDAWNVTFFRFVFTTLELATRPAANHTSMADVQANFAGMTPAPPSANYMVVLQNKELNSATVLYKQHRTSALGVGGLAGGLALAGLAVTGAAAACAVGYFVLKKRARATTKEMPSSPK